MISTGIGVSHLFDFEIRCINFSQSNCNPTGSITIIKQDTQTRDRSSLHLLPGRGGSEDFGYVTIKFT